MTTVLPQFEDARQITLTSSRNASDSFLCAAMDLDSARCVCCLPLHRQHTPPPFSERERQSTTRAYVLACFQPCYTHRQLSQFRFCRHTFLRLMSERLFQHLQLRLQVCHASGLLPICTAARRCHSQGWWRTSPRCHHGGVGSTGRR